MGAVSSNQGGITCDEMGGDCTELYDEGTMVTLMDTADSGSTFIAWGGDCSAGGSVTMSAARSCTATFDSP